MISLIPIPNDFKEINAQYKKFKQDTFKKLCESNETFIQAEESNLINSINQIIEESEKNNDENNDENCMRILIGAKTLSKYSIINQNLCQQYFSLINEQKFPKSIPKIRFFIKCVVKQIKNQLSVKWEKFIHHFHQNFLILENGPQPVQNTLIYIDFLIQYAPNFAVNFSKNIFYHLFKTIKKYDFILDLNYDIVKYLNQNTDTFLENKRYLANYAIELLRKFFEKVKIIPNQSKEISGILKWEYGIKKLATLAVILEKCQKSFLLDNIDLIHQCLIEIKSSDIEIECLKNSNFLFLSIIKNQVNKEIIQKILSIQYDCNYNVICSQLQNVNLLINKKLLNLDDNEKIIQIILSCLKKFPLKKLIIRIVIKMLNNWCLFNKSLKIDHELITCLNQQEIHYDCFEVIKLMIQNDSKTFKSSLLNSLDHSNLNIIKTLNFLNGLQKEQILDFIDDKIENRIFDLAYDTNENIRSIIPLIAVKISPNKLFSGNHLNHLINSLSSDSSEKVKISIIRCFNDHLSKENLNDFSELKEKFNDPIFANILRNLLLCFSFHNIQIETIKFVSKLSKFQSNQLDFSDVILPYYLDFFTSFSKNSQNDSDACLNNDYSNFLPFKLLKISEMLPYIFDSFPQFYLKYFEQFYNYSMDFMNLVSNDLKCYKNLTNLTLDTTQSALHKLKFYSKIFCSFIKSFEVILKNDPDTIKPYFEDIIKFCFYKLPNGVDRAETEHILSLLEKVLYTIGLEEILQNEKIQRNIKELYTKVLNTGSRFISSNNHQHIFRILGFIGAQLPYEKPLPIYSDANEKEQFDINLQEIMMDNSDEQYNTMYYLICSNALFQILDNQSLSYFHLNALETLADLLGSMPLHYKTNARKTFFDEKKFIKNHFSSCFNYFMKLFKKADKTDKKFFVNIFELLLGVNNKILAPYVDKFVDIFIDLWEYESIDLLKQLINQFGNLLESYLCRIIPLIQSCNNYDTIVDSLYFIYVKYYAFKNMKSTDINVIDIIINIAFNFEYFKAIHTLKKIFNSNSNELMNYANDIIKLCLKYLNNNNEADPSYLNDTVDLLCLLVNLRSDDNSCFLTDYIPSIKKALENNEQLLMKFDDQCNKSNANFIRSSASEDNLTTKHPHFGSPSNQQTNSDASNKQHKKIGFAIMDLQSVESNQGRGCIKTGTPPRKQLNKPASEDNLIQKHPRFGSPSTNTSFSDQSGKSSNASFSNKKPTQKISFGFNQQPQTDASKNVSFGGQNQASSESSSQSSGMSSPSQHRPQKISFGFNQQPQTDSSKNESNLKNVSFVSQTSSESSSQSSGMSSPSQHRSQKISFGFNQQSQVSSSKNESSLKSVSFVSQTSSESSSQSSGMSSPSQRRPQKISFGFNQQPQTDASKNVSFGSESQASSESSSQSSGMSSPSQHRPQKISFGFNQHPQTDSSKNESNLKSVSFVSQTSSESSSQSSGMSSPSQHRPQKISFGFNQQPQADIPKNDSSLKNVSFGSQSNQSSNTDPAKSGTKKISFALTEPSNQQPASPSKKPLFEVMASNSTGGCIKTGTPPRKAPNEPKSSLKPSFSSIKDSPTNQVQSKISFGEPITESFLTEEQTKLIEFIKSINVVNEISSLYIDQWLNELILFCIQNSSNSIIQKVCRIAKKNEILAISIFNISFHSIISSINHDLYKEIKKDISKVFLSILQNKKTSHHCKVILINLIEFLDRHLLPIEDPSDFPEMITSLFDNNNAISLRYSLLKFEKNKYKDYKTGLNDVEHAFMNSGLLDEYQEFSDIYGKQNIDNLPFIPIFSGAMTEKQKQEQMDKLNNWSPNIIPQIYKVESLIRNYWSAFPTERNEEKEKEIQLEIDKGFVTLAIEGGPHFSQGYTSVIPYIIYGQELTELTELYKNPQKDNFHLRFMNSSQIFSFLPPILLLRIATKEGLKDSLREKYEILTLCRQAKRWKMMKQYNDFFTSVDKETPVEIEYEMLYYKIANDLELDEKDFELQNDNNENCYIKNLDKLVAFQKAVYYSRESKHKSNKKNSMIWKNVIYLCKYMNNNVEAINLMGKANLELFKLDENSSFLNEAIICFIDSAKKSEKVRISNILLIISLLFAHYNQTDRGLHSISIEDISEELNQIPLDFYVNVMSQIISYIPDLEEKRFKKYMVNLLTSIMEKFPQGVIYDYAYSLVSDNRTSQNVIISSPMKEVRQKLINNAQVQHIFSEAFDLINNLEKVNSDFISSLLGFLNNTINYLKDNHEDYENERFRNKEINFFIDHFVEPLKNYYGVQDQDPDADQDNVYNPNYKEKTMVDNFKDNFGQLEELIDELFEFFNLETDSEKDHKIQIYGKLRSFINEVNKFKSKNFKSDTSPSKLFKLCPDMEKMKDLSLPVFSTYQMNLYSNILIQAFMNDFTEFSTLQRPKKIIIVGSDGHFYPFLLKKSEDLRSDQRVMIFHKFMNQFISTKIKTYAVIPLTSYFGAIQFVHETEGLSSMINCYREKIEKKKNKVNYSRYEHEYFRENFGKTQECFDKLTSIQKIETFRNLIDNEHINDLRESFWHLTINSEMWLKFFKNYLSTCAVTSIVGYIIGLGDRHLSNIMINKRDGSLMHIDFCDLFEKDQIVQSYTEKVPFRLTPYMIKALGPCGFNGSFRYKCEETLSIIRENRYIIKNILKVFLDSPIVEAEARPFSLVTSLTLIQKRKKSNKKLIERISDKVNGTDTTFIYSSDPKIGKVEPIPVNKQVDKLIKCATNELNLGCSFWEPWK